MKIGTYLRNQLTAAHEFLEETIGEITDEQLHAQPGGRALPVGAAYAHVIYSEDMLVQGVLKSTSPLFTWPGSSTGASEHMPGFTEQEWPTYSDWTKRVKFEMASLRQYATRVYAATDEYLASLGEEDFDREMDLTGFGMGTQSLAWFVGRTLIGHVDNLTGEISAAKGVQGLQGYTV